jgi:BON domain
VRKRSGVGSALCALALGAWLTIGCQPPEPEYEGTFVTLVSADAALAARVQEALAAQGVRMEGVGVSVANGVVALFGSVPSEADRREAEAIARVVHDVQGVRNELVVGPAPLSRPPPAIASR